MKEHPSIPLRSAPNGIVRNMKNVGKPSSSVTYHQVGLKVYADPSSDTSIMLDDGDWGFFISEVDGTSNYNWVRDVHEHTGVVETGDHSTPVAPGDLLVDTTINLTNNADTYYVFRGSYDGNFAMGVTLAFAPDGNGGAISQATNWSNFTGFTDVDITTTSMITLGTSPPHPAAHMLNGVQYDTSFKPALNSKTIWIWLTIG